MIQSRECPACKKKFTFRGGAIRIPTDENDVGYHEFDICKPCAALFQQIDKRQSENSVQDQAVE